MKKYIPLLLILLACSESETDHQEESVTEEIISEDTTKVEEEIIEVKDTTNEVLVSLLDNPINLPELKKELGPSNSGHSGSHDALFKPDTVGQYYRYFLFGRLRVHAKKQPLSTQDLADGLRIKVYKYGEEIGDFYDTNEELILLECNLNISVLNELNLVGKSSEELKESYDEPQFELDHCLVYTHKGRTITAHLSNGKVDWFKFAKLKEGLLLPDELPDFMTTY